MTWRYCNNTHWARAPFKGVPDYAAFLVLMRLYCCLKCLTIQRGFMFMVDCDGNACPRCGSVAHRAEHRGSGW
jgi:hypothetical protein